MNLTQIKAAKPGQILKDDEVRGLELHVRKGGAGSWMLYYRIHGQRRRPKIGDHPGLKLAQAREIARQWLADVARGDDPSATKAATRGAETLQALAERFHTAQPRRTAIRHERGFLRRQLADLAGRKIPTLRPGDLEAVKRASAPVAFNRCRAFVLTTLRWGGYRDVAEALAVVGAHKERPRQRYLTDDELLRLHRAITAHEARWPHQMALIRLLLLTGARLSEIQRARRDWLQGDVLHLPRHKGDEAPKTIALSEAAMQVVASVSPRRGWLVGFASYPNAGWAAVRETARLGDFRLHDLRHTHASILLAEGYTLGQIGEVLGHQDASTTRRYAHLTTTAKARAAATVADIVARKTAKAG